MPSYNNRRESADTSKIVFTSMDPLSGENSHNSSPRMINKMINLQYTGGISPNKLMSRTQSKF